MLPPAMRAQLTGLGFPCPPIGPTAVAVPAAAVVDSALADPDDVVDSALADPIVAGEVAIEADEALDPKPKKTREEAESREHRMTHLPKKKTSLRGLL